jgi:pimeloyl-ACP methyl ester carboxylesterase
MGLQKFKASDGLEIAYVLDDYTDPWRAVDTVILVHAAMGSSTRFYAWVPHLAGDFRVVRIDMRGHGATQAPGPDQLSPQRLVQDVAELADHIGAEHFHVGGSSAGAVVAEKVAIDYPQRGSSTACRIRGRGCSRSASKGWPRSCAQRSQIGSI